MAPAANQDLAAALSLLQAGANAPRSAPETSEAALLEALALAPQDFDIRLGAYRFYFYTHRYDEALVHCEELIAHAARGLNIATDWRLVTPQDAPFGTIAFAPGLFLQTLIAWGYCQLRLGETGRARQALAHAAWLDPSDRFGAAAIVGHIDARHAEDNEE